MNIVFLRSNPVAPDPRLEKEASTLVQAGHKVTVLCWDRWGKYKYKQDTIKLPVGECQAVRFGVSATFGGGMKNLMPRIKLFINMSAWLIKHRKEYDVIHACDFDMASIGYFCARLCGKKLVYDVYDYFSEGYLLPWFLERPVEFMENHIIKKADGVIICSEKRLEQLKCTPKNLAVVHNTPRTEQMQPCDTSFYKDTKNDRIRIAYVGIFNASRCLTELVDCVARRDDCELHIGGFGIYSEQFKNMAENHDNIIYYDRLPYEKTLYLESMCHIITAIYVPDCPNHLYAAPNKYYEALMLGKPLIYTDTVSLFPLKDSKEIGELVVQYDEQGVNDALNRLIARKSEWEQISQRMNTIYTENFDWQIMAGRLERLYELL